MAAWATTPIREKLPTITHIESRTDQKGHLRTLETLIARLGMYPARCGDHIVAPQDKSQLGGTHGHAPTRESPIHINKQQRWSFFCLPEFSRVAKLLAIMAAWPTNSNERAHSDTDTHQITYWLQRKSTDLRNTNHSHSNDFLNLALWRPHHGGSKQQPTWRLKSSRSYAGISNTHEQQRWSCPFLQNSRESRNMLAIMASEHPTIPPTRCPLQQEQKSNHALTTHFHGNSWTSRSRATRLDVPTTCTTKRCGYHTVMTMVRSQLGGIHLRAPERGS